MKTIITTIIVVLSLSACSGYPQEPSSFSEEPTQSEEGVRELRQAISDLKSYLDNNTN